jgi:protein-tyrosine phosphatase
VIDIHCHILHGIDDGPDHFEESVEMARIAYADGIRKIVATPHIKDSLIPLEAIESKIYALSKRLSGRKIDVRLFRGADVRIRQDAASLLPYTINGTQYILTEFPHTYLPRNAGEILFGLMLEGLHPILTHPERNLAVLMNPDILFDLLQPGISVQITAGSLTGDFGPDIRACAAYLLRKGIVSFIATDAHSPTERRPVLSAGVKDAGKIVGDEKAIRMVTENPERVLQGLPLQ